MQRGLEQTCMSYRDLDGDLRVMYLQESGTERTYMGRRQSAQCPERENRALCSELELALSSFLHVPLVRYGSGPALIDPGTGCAWPDHRRWRLGTRSCSSCDGGHCANVTSAAPPQKKPAATSL